MSTEEMFHFVKKLQELLRVKGIRETIINGISGGLFGSIESGLASKGVYSL